MRNACIQGCDIHGEQILQFKVWILVILNQVEGIGVSLMYVGSDRTSGCRTTSRYSEMCSVGQLQAETIGLPGMLALCILGST